jgi:ribonuclease G
MSQEEILLNIGSKEIRYAHLKNGQLHDLIVERKKSRLLTGNIYRGEVRNILHNIQSAFIDIDEGENGFIHITDVIENTKKFEKMFDMSFEMEEKSKPSKKRQADVEIDQVMKLDQPVLVQVIKEPIGSKGARLTSNVSLAGRYLVLLPNTLHRGVSRKIEGRAARDRLKKIIRAFDMPQDMGLICRTESRNATVDMLVEEASELIADWEKIVEKFQSSKKPCCLYEEYDIVRKSVFQGVQKKFDRLLVDNYSTYQTCKRIAEKYLKEHNLRVEFYRDKIPMYERFGVEREIEKALKRKIWLSSGGYLYFDHTEAMYTIDVNSGRYTGDDDASSLEETLVRINLEAAEEIARQMRLRNIGGLVICDFIDMRMRKNQRRVLDRLKDCMREDSTKCVVLGMSEFGLVEMTRQRRRESLEQTLLWSCPYCSGNGLIKTHESIAIGIERDFYKVVNCHQQYGLKLVVHPTVYEYLLVDDNAFFFELAEKLNAQLEIEKDDNLHLNDYYFYSSINNKKIDV